MADKVKCGRCGGELEPIGTKNDLICVDCNLVQNGTGEPKAEVTGVVLTDIEKDFIANADDTDEVIKRLEHVLDNRLTALQSAHEKELAELRKSIIAEAIAALPEEEKFPHDEYFQGCNDKLAEVKSILDGMKGSKITSAIEAIDKEAGEMSELENRPPRVGGKSGKRRLVIWQKGYRCGRKAAYKHILDNIPKTTVDTSKLHVYAQGYYEAMSKITSAIEAIDKEAGK